MAQVAQGSKDGSLRNYRAIIELTPRTDLVLGAIRAAQGDVRKSVIAASAPALERLDRRCRDFSESAWAANEYAWLAAQMQSNLDTALARATKSVEVEPKNAAYCDTLAEVHFRKGDRTAALKHNQQCLKLQPGNNYYLRQRERFERGEIESVPK
jgi:tetratricopeptide (TPR) repeat protein